MIPSDRATILEDLEAFAAPNDLGVYVYVYRGHGEDTSKKAGANRALDGEGRRPTFVELRKAPDKMRPRDRVIKLTVYLGHYWLIAPFERLVNERRNVTHRRQHARHVCSLCMMRFDNRFK